MRISLALIVATAAATACSSAGGAPATHLAVDSAGITIVRNERPLWSYAESWSVSDEARVTIGVLDGAAAYQLHDVVAAKLQSEGDIVLVDGGTREVRLYDSAGTFLKELGGPGSGPGEFEYPVQVLVTAGDTISVWDDALARVTRFNPQGELLDIRTVDRGQIAKAIDPPMYPGTARLLPDGNLMVRLTEKAMTKQAAKTGNQGSEGGSRARSGALRVSADYARVDTLMFFGDAELVDVAAPWGDWRLPPPRAKTTVLAVHSDESRVCIGDQRAAEIACFGPDGSHTLIRWTPKQVAVTEADVTVWRDTTVELLAGKLSESQVIGVLEQVVVPAVRPPFSEIRIDAAGNLWAEQGPSEENVGSIDYLVFDPTGVLLGTVATPPVRILDIGHDYLLGVYEDDLEVQYLKLFDILKP
ncbi:MAG: hypothetical protein JSW51_01015 [Gemmatimonadota bacterium]|nr:MAG: hypothetical protein JSW51_01015 [Gemmatimonadota bacterium]